MIINTMIYMLFVGIFGLLRLHIRADRILSWVMFFIILGLFGEYNLQNISGKVDGFSVLWASTQIGNITLDFNPALTTNQIIIPLFFLSLVTILNNNIFRYEERRCAFNSFIIFNLVSLSLLICAENYVQLITMVFVTDIFGYLILKDKDCSRRYVIYNFFADMCLFMILALACGKIHNLDMSRLLGYEQIGRHKDFVSLVTGVALLIKMGCFPFQTYLVDISNARFQRMSTAFLLFSPITGVLLLIKLHNLLLISDLFLPLFNIIVLLSLINGVGGFIAQRNIQKKVMCLNMCLFAMLLQQLQINNFSYSLSVSLYFLFIYLFNQLYFKLYLYQNRETDILKMLNAKMINSGALKGLLIQFGLLNASFLVFVKEILATTAQWYIWLEAGIIFVAQAIILNHIYKSPNEHRVDYLNNNPVRVLSFIFNSLLLLGMMGYFWQDKIWLVTSVLVFMTIIASPLGEKFRILYEKEIIQDKDLSQSFFAYAVILPISYISKLIWFVLDIFLSEKIINATVSALQKNSIALFLKINKKSYGASLLFVIIGIMIFILAYYGEMR